MIEEEPVCLCGHGRKQHDRHGCGWEEPDGSDPCLCTVTHMELSPSNPARKIKEN